jgi:hypothetical protein
VYTEVYLPAPPQVEYPVKAGIRNYESVVQESHFPLGFLAPKMMTPENRKEIESIQAASGTPSSPLLGKSCWHLEAV